MSNVVVYSANIVSFPKPCSLCGMRGDVQFFAGLMLCETCKTSIEITNPQLTERVSTSE